jgi:hypothetical protein
MASIVCRPITYRPYSKMCVDDYAPYKALNLSLGLFGPAPRLPASCTCGAFIVDDYCACASECWKMPKHKWAKANPRLYKAEQEEERAWFRRCQFWQQQQAEFAEKQLVMSMHILQEFDKLQDLESSIGCLTCEKNRRHSCRCACDGCGSKYCNGDCACENEWVY